MPDNILEVLLEKIINNWRKVYGAIVGFIVGLVVINYGILKAIVVFAETLGLQNIAVIP